MLSLDHARVFNQDAGQAEALTPISLHSEHDLAMSTGIATTGLCY